MIFFIRPRPNSNNLVQQNLFKSQRKFMKFNNDKCGMTAGYVF